MTIVVVTPPVSIVTFAEVEKHLADVPAEDKDYVEALIAAATAWIDGPAGWLGRAIGVQELEARGWFACDRLSLPCPPIVEIVSISYADPDGVRQDADPDTYRLDGNELAVSPGAAWVRQPDHRIRYWAGYGKRDPNDPQKWINDAPAPIKVAVMMLVAQWYNTRENVVIGAAPTTMPFAVDQLLHLYRVYR